MTTNIPSAMWNWFGAQCFIKKKISDVSLRYFRSSLNAISLVSALFVSASQQYYRIITQIDQYLLHYGIFTFIYMSNGQELIH